MSKYDVVIVGAGNAAFCAAHAAREKGASVLMLECASEAESGCVRSFEDRKRRQRRAA